MKIYNCIDCGKRIKYKNTLRCRKCYNSFRAVEQPLCIDCGKPVNKSHKPKRCQSCSGKHWFKINKIKSIRTRLIDKIPDLKKKIIDLYVNKKISFSKIALKLKISKTSISRLIKFFKIKQRSLSDAQKLLHLNGITRNYCCQDCGGYICRDSALYGHGRCHKCDTVVRRNRGDFDNIKRPKGKDNHNWKGGLPKCVDCGKQLLWWGTKRCGDCSKKFMVGEENPNWRGGIGRDGYPYEFSDELKYEIRQRDNFTCQFCGLPSNEHFRGKEIINLYVHHIDYNKFNCDKNNLISLCLKCHLKTNGNRDYWFAYCRYLIDNKIKL